MRTAVQIAFNQLIKEVVWGYLQRRKPSNRRNLAVVGSRRSGSTLIMQVLAANQGVTFSNQPLSIFSASSYQMRWLPVHRGGQLFNLDNEERDLLAKYIAGILDGSLRVHGPWRFWRRDFDFTWDRMVLKLTNAHGIADWLTKTFELDTIALFRHPIPQSLSVIRNNWRLQGVGFLENESFRSEYLSESQVAKAYDILKHGSKLERYVLDWCLENLPLLRAYANRLDWYLLTFEEFVSDPNRIIAEWSEQFSLPNVARMQRSSAQKSLAVSGLSSAANKRAIELANSEAILSSWKTQIDPGMERSAMSIPEMFEIDLYRAGSVKPTIGRRPGTRKPV